MEITGKQLLIIAIVSEVLKPFSKIKWLYVKNIVNATEKSYQIMYALVCTCILFYTIIGAD